MSSKLFVPSVCLTVMSHESEASRLRMWRLLTLRCVLAAGEATTVVVVAVVIEAVLVRPGVMVPEA
jgi:hypothetical protein